MRTFATKTLCVFLAVLMAFASSPLRAGPPVYSGYVVRRAPVLVVRPPMPQRYIIIPRGLPPGMVFVPSARPVLPYVPSGYRSPYYTPRRDYAPPPRYFDRDFDSGGEASTPKRTLSSSSKDGSDSSIAILALGLLFLPLLLEGGAVAAGVEALEGAEAASIASGAEVTGAARAFAGRAAATEAASFTRTALASENRIYAIGRLADTAEAGGWWTQYERLDIADWTLAKNDAYVQGIIRQRAKVYLATPPTESALWDAVSGRQTVFGRELQQLRQAGYRMAGRTLMVPP